MTRLYHGTRSASLIRKYGFKASTGGEFGPGIYLTANPDTARFYATHVARGDEAPEVLPVALLMLNPFRVRKVDWIKMTQRSTPRTVQARLIKKGYDGIVGIAINDYEEQIIAFWPAQVRLSDER